MNFQSKSEWNKKTVEKEPRAEMINRNNEDEGRVGKEEWWWWWYNDDLLSTFTLKILSIINTTKNKYLIDNNTLNLSFISQSQVY